MEVVEQTCIYAKEVIIMSKKLVRYGSTKKVLKRIDTCKNAGVTVDENLMIGTTVATWQNVEILRCQKQSPDKWLMEYHADYWEEVDV